MEEALEEALDEDLEEDDAREVWEDPLLVLVPEPRDVEAPLRAGEVRVAMRPRIVEIARGPRGYVRSAREYRSGQR